MGGGRQMLQSNSTAKPGDPIDTWACYSKDGRNLIDDWVADKARRNFLHTVVQNNDELSKVDPEKTDFLLGVFANGHISMDWERLTGPEGQPSLEQMTSTAIKVLRKSKKGFILVVGTTDHFTWQSCKMLVRLVPDSVSLNSFFLSGRRRPHWLRASPWTCGSSLTRNCEIIWGHKRDTEVSWHQQDSGHCYQRSWTFPHIPRHQRERSKHSG